MDLDSAPPPLLLAPLLQDLHAWLSSPTLSSAPLVTPTSSNQTPSGTAAAAIRASSALFNLLPASRGTTPPPPPTGSPTPAAGGNGPKGEDDKGKEETKKKKVKCRCVEAYGNNLYIGTSDGQVLWYTFSPVGSSSEPYTLQHRHTIFPRRPISSIHLLPSISKALILSESTLHFVSLPTLEPVPSGLIQSVRGVVAVAVDEGPEGVEGEKNVCVIKRRGVGIYRLGTRLFHVKDVPLPEVPILAKYHHPYLCISDLETYSLVSLLETTLSPVLPVSQLADPADLPFRVRPNIAVVQEDEFLITSCNNANGIGGTVGVFISGEGDPVRGSVEWDENPRSLVVQPPYIVALLRSGAIQIHSLLTLETIDLLPPPANIDPRLLSLSLTGFQVPSVERDRQLRQIAIPLLPPVKEKEQEDRPNESGFEEPSGSGLTPPSSPTVVKSSFDRPTSGSRKGKHTTTSSQLSQILLLSNTSTHSLTPTPALTLALQAMDKTGSSVEKALEPLLISAATQGEQDDEAVRFVHQKVFLRGLRDARFGAVGEGGEADGGGGGTDQAQLFILSQADFRLVVRLFQELRVVLEDSEKEGGEVFVEAGLADEWSQLWDVEEITQANLKRNYDPHLEPSVDDAPEAVELRQALLDQAREMLRVILASERDRSRGKGKVRNPATGKIVDTCLLLLLAQSGSTKEIMDLLDSSHLLADMSLVQTSLRKHQRWFALAQTLSEADAIEIYVDIVEETKPDPDCFSPPFESILKIVSRSSSVPLVEKYGKWLSQRTDVESSEVWAAIGGDAFGSRSAENNHARRRLLMGLVKERMALETKPAVAATLLNEHSLHLDLVEVLDHVPDDWQLSSISPFLVRSLRKDLQRREEGQILKAISASLNLRVLDCSLEAFAKYPPVTQNGPPPVSVGDGEKSRSAHEGNAEKAGIVQQVLDGLGAQVDSQDLEAKEVLRAVQSDEEEESIA